MKWIQIQQKLKSAAQIQQQHKSSNKQKNLLRGKLVWGNLVYIQTSKEGLDIGQLGKTKAQKGSILMGLGIPRVPLAFASFTPSTSAHLCHPRVSPTPHLMQHAGTTTLIQLSRLPQSPSSHLVFVTSTIRQQGTQHLPMPSSRVPNIFQHPPTRYPTSSNCCQIH